MLTADVQRWFDSYLADYAALARGELDDPRRVLAHYGVPLLLSTDASCVALVDEAQVAAAVQRQIDDLRAAGYDRSEQLAADTVVLNCSCATHRVLLSSARCRVDGGWSIAARSSR